MTTIAERAGLSVDPAVRRYHDIRDLLPDVDNPSPLVRLNHVPPAATPEAYLKLEWFNPFGSVKDRTAAYLLAGLEERGLLAGKEVVEASSGNTAIALGDEAGYEVMARIVGDENLHHLFYRDLCAAALELDPSGMVLAIADEVEHFAMPGTGIPDFDRHAKAIAKAGIYDLAVHHDQILQPVVVRHWKVGELTGLTPEAEAARDRLLDRIERTGRVARRMAERRADSVGAPA